MTRQVRRHFQATRNFIVLTGRATDGALIHCRRGLIRFRMAVDLTNGKTPANLD